MSCEYLQIIVDFNIDKLAQNQAEIEKHQTQQGQLQDFANPLQIFFDSILKFVNAFQIQNSKNKYRIILALPQIKNGYKTQVLFPQDLYTNEDGKEILYDNAQLQKFGFESIRTEIYKRLFRIIESIDQERDKIEKSNINQAFMKAICQANKQILADKNVNNRIFIIQMEKDDTAKYTSLVNGLFASEKMRITLDCLVLSSTFEDSLRETAAQQKSGKQVAGANIQQSASYLMIQGAQMTNGIFRELSGKWCMPKGSSILLFELINNFLPTPGQSRQILKLPLSSQMEQAKMSSKCICHPGAKEGEQAIGYICENCLALHCFQTHIEQLKVVNKGKGNKEQIWQKIQKLDEGDDQRKCKNCQELFIN